MKTLTKANYKIKKTKLYFVQKKVIVKKAREISFMALYFLQII